MCPVNFIKIKGADYSYLVWKMQALSTVTIGQTSMTRTKTGRSGTHGQSALCVMHGHTWHVALNVTCAIIVKIKLEIMKFALGKTIVSSYVCFFLVIITVDVYSLINVLDF